MPCRSSADAAPPTATRERPPRKPTATSGPRRCSKNDARRSAATPRCATSATTARSTRARRRPKCARRSRTRERTRAALLAAPPQRGVPQHTAAARYTVVARDVARHRCSYQPAEPRISLRWLATRLPRWRSPMDHAHALTTPAGPPPQRGSRGRVPNPRPPLPLPNRSNSSVRTKTSGRDESEVRFKPLFLSRCIFP